MMSNIPNKKARAEIGRIVKPGVPYYCRITSAKPGTDTGEGLRISCEPFDKNGEPVPPPANSNEERATVKISFFDSPDGALRKQLTFVGAVLWEADAVEAELVGVVPQDLVERWFVGSYEYKKIRKKSEESGEWEDTGDERLEIAKAESVRKGTPEYDFCVNLAGNFYGDPSIPDLDPSKISGATAAAETAKDTKSAPAKTPTQQKKAEKAEKAAAGVAATAASTVDASDPFAEG